MPLTPGNNLNSVPAPIQQTLISNYIDFTDAGANSANWAQQYLPDLMEKEAEVFGPRTISGFLSQVGAEEAMTSDQVVWSEQGRLHLSYTGNVNNGTGGVDSVGQVTITGHIDANATYTASSHGVRVNDTVIVSNVNGTFKCLVTTVAADVIDVAPYTANALTTLATADATTILVYGSEYTKGVSYMDGGAVTTQSDSRGANEPTFQSFTNKPIIIKDYYEISGSDTARIGWVEVASETGQSGYMWYLKAESDTRARFTDYLEMAMLEGELAGTSLADSSNVMYNAATAQVGTQGLFAAITDRGNLTSGVVAAQPPNVNLDEFDLILAEFDNQGAIEENMMFLNRAT